MITVRFAKLNQYATIPRYATELAAGADLFAAMPSKIWLHPGERQLIPTGLAIEIPAGYEGQIRPRSGLAIKTGITVLNAPGTIDADYRGEVQVILINHSRNHAYIVQPGDRIAQLVIAPVTPVTYVCVASVEDLSQTIRGESGYGSTGR
jgi:dUTP pyrophosphatase